MSPMFSIIIPVYNVAAYLRECLDSVLAQSCGDWEAICVDDGSTDGSEAIIDEYVNRDPRFKKIKKVNGGLSSARNAAFPLLKGELVGFLDADDKIEADWLASVRSAKDRYDADLYRLNLKFWFSDKAADECCRRANPAGTMYLKDPTEVLRWGWASWLGRAWVCVYFVKSRILIGSGCRFSEDALVMEDVIFDATLLPHLSSIVQIPYDGYCYRQREGSLWHKPRSGRCSINLFHEFAQIISDQSDSIKSANMPDVVFRRIMRIVWWELHAWLLTHLPEEDSLKRSILKAADDLLSRTLMTLPFGRSASRVRIVVRLLLGIMGCYTLHLFLSWAMIARRAVKSRFARR